MYDTLTDKSIEKMFRSILGQSYSKGSLVNAKTENDVRVKNLPLSACDSLSKCENGMGNVNDGLKNSKIHHG